MFINVAKKTIQIIRLLIKKSHDQYRNTKKTNRTILNLAIKSFFVEIKQFLLRFLNKINLYVQKTHMSHRDVVRIWDMGSRELMMNKGNKREQIASRDREKNHCVSEKNNL